MRSASSLERRVIQVPSTDLEFETALVPLETFLMYSKCMPCAQDGSRPDPRRHLGDINARSVIRFPLSSQVRTTCSTRSHRREAFRLSRQRDESTRPADGRTCVPWTRAHTRARSRPLGPFSMNTACTPKILSGVAGRSC